MMGKGLLLVIAGIWLLFQTTKGGLVQRLGLP